MHDEDIQVYSRNLILVKKKSMPHPFVGALRIPGVGVLLEVLAKDACDAVFPFDGGGLVDVRCLVLRVIKLVDALDREHVTIACLTQGVDEGLAPHDVVALAIPHWHAGLLLCNGEH